jgi:hypothetical protein
VQNRVAKYLVPGDPLFEEAGNQVQKGSKQKRSCAPIQKSLGCCLFIIDVPQEPTDLNLFGLTCGKRHPQSLVGPHILTKISPILGDRSDRSPFVWCNNPFLLVQFHHFPPCLLSFPEFEPPKNLTHDFPNYEKHKM